jgi:hypothetical protein
MFETKQACTCCKQHELVSVSYNEFHALLELKMSVYMLYLHLITRYRTPDEDFGILLEAALMYDRRVAAILNEDDSLDEEIVWKEISDGKQCLYPRLLFVITGIIFCFFTF